MTICRSRRLLPGAHFAIGFKPTQSVASKSHLPTKTGIIVSTSLPEPLTKSFAIHHQRNPSKPSQWLYRMACLTRLLTQKSVRFRGFSVVTQGGKKQEHPSSHRTLSAASDFGHASRRIRQRLLPPSRSESRSTRSARICTTENPGLRFDAVARTSPAKRHLLGREEPSTTWPNGYRAPWESPDCPRTLYAILGRRWRVPATADEGQKLQIGQPTSPDRLLFPRPSESLSHEAYRRMALYEKERKRHFRGPR